MAFRPADWTVHGDEREPLVEGLLKLAGNALLLFALTFVPAQYHPVTGAAALLLRWPAMALCFLVGGGAFSRSMWKVVVRVLVAMAVLFASWFHHFLVRATPDVPPEGTVRRPLRVLTSHLPEVQGDPGMALEALRSRKAEVYALQGVTDGWRTRLAQENALRPLHREGATTPTTGVMLMSPHAIRGAQPVVDADGTTVAVCADVAAEAGVVHACSVLFSEPPWRDDWVETARHFPVNAQRRLRQWDALASHLRTHGTTPVVVAGDFGTLEWEPLYDAMERTYVDAFRRGSWDWGATWPARNPEVPFPVVRRDFVFVSPTLGVTGAEVLPLTGSAHRPVVVTLER